MHILKENKKPIEAIIRYEVSRNSISLFLTTQRHELALSTAGCKLIDLQFGSRIWVIKPCTYYRMNMW